MIGLTLISVFKVICEFFMFPSSQLPNLGMGMINWADSGTTKIKLTQLRKSQT